MDTCVHCDKLSSWLEARVYIPLNNQLDKILHYKAVLNVLEMTHLLSIQSDKELR